ncbi:MAG: RNA polymerase sigma factor [Pyrinomonadaceae bacterium]|jgi:RNA polymerase sigma-70 factor (ECF subfamily)|nr:RNA polymerase sigma factor [Pyrinomonadaceae bacterium]MDQ3584713.1 RNA polymerase sigma factor [Acidobacteriota bacterium]
MTNARNLKRETWWVLRAQSGDREALTELLEAVQEPLYRYVFRLTGERTMAEDILQEVFILIYRKLRWLQEPELFRPWAYRIASREAFKRLRRERRWREQVRDESILEAIPAQPPAEDLAAGIAEQLPVLIARVSPASRAVLVLHYLHEMPLTEVAAVLGIALGTAKSRLAYGLHSLRRAVNEQRGSDVESCRQKAKT